VATVPSELHDAFRREQKLMYGLLMRVSAEAVKELCARKRHLGAMPGLLSVLHTWNGQLGYHPHVHMLITGGGITPDGEHWEPARGEFLVPLAVLSKKIAAKFRDALKKQKPKLFASIPAVAWRRQWVSFLKHYGHGNDAVLNYLSLLQHVLPRGFHKVRYYGLWHASKRGLASRAWLLLILQKPTDTAGPPKIADLLEALDQLTELDEQPRDGTDSPCCPYCGSPRTSLLGQWPDFGEP